MYLLHFGLSILCPLWIFLFEYDGWPRLVCPFCSSIGRFLATSSDSQFWRGQRTGQSKWAYATSKRCTTSTTIDLLRFKWKVNKLGPELFGSRNDEEIMPPNFVYNTSAIIKKQEKKWILLIVWFNGQWQSFTGDNPAPSSSDFFYHHPPPSLILFIRFFLSPKWNKHSILNKKRKHFSRERNQSSQKSWFDIIIIWTLMVDIND